jgi:hypothetical protein
LIGKILWDLKKLKEKTYRSKKLTRTAKFSLPFWLLFPPFDGVGRFKYTILPEHRLKPFITRLISH